MRIMLPTLALTALFAAHPAVAAERRYSVTDFDRIEVSGPFQVSLATGLSSGARATGSQAALDRVSVEVQGRTLRIRTNRNAWGGYPGEDPGPVTIEATTRDLRAASVVGSGGLAVDRARGLRLDLSVSGSGRLGVATLDADNVVIGLLGAGRIVVGGKAKQLKATIQGSGDLDGRNLKADDVTLFSDTAGAVSMGAVRSANVKASGPGDVEILGTPSCTVQALGSGRVKCGR